MMLPERFFLESLGIYCRTRLPPPDMKDEHYHRQVERRFWMVSILLAVVTTLITVFGAGAAYLAYRAARDQATTAAAQLEGDERAYVAVTGLEAKFVNESVNKELVQINPVLKNTGKLPAKNLRSIAATLTCRTPLPDGLFPKRAIKDSSGETLLAGQQESRIVIRHALNENEREAIRRGGARAFLYGTLTYDDSFEKTSLGSPVQHRLRYCFALLALPADELIKTGSVTLSDVYLCGEKTNCNDDDCGNIEEASGSCNSFDGK